MSTSTKKTVKKKVEEVSEVTATESKQESTLLLEQQLQLKVNERKVLAVYPGANHVVVTNEFGGELYVTNKDVEFTKEHVVRPGESVEFENPTYIFVGSYSRPVFTVKHFVK
jgi:hypothetical protein